MAEGRKRVGGWAGIPRRFVNVPLKLEQAERLRVLAEQQDCSQASLVRRGVDMVLRDEGEPEE